MLSRAFRKYTVQMLRLYLGNNSSEVDKSICILTTRMHSSRMHTIHCSGCQSDGEGAVCPGGCLPRGVCPGGVYPLWTEFLTHACENIDSAWWGFLINADWSASLESTDLTNRKI